MDWMKAATQVRYWSDFQKLGLSPWAIDILMLLDTRTGTIDPIEVCQLIQNDLEEKYGFEWTR